MRLRVPAIREGRLVLCEKRSQARVRGKDLSNVFSYNNLRVVLLCKKLLRALKS